MMISSQLIAENLAPITSLFIKDNGTSSHKSKYFNNSPCNQLTNQLHSCSLYDLRLVSLLIFFFGLFGNIMVLYVVGYRKKQRKSGDIYIVALACTDLLTLLGIITFTISTVSSGSHNSNVHYYERKNSVVMGLSQATICASSWFLVLISMDRYRIISKPLTRERNPVLRCLAMALVWTTSIGFIVPDMLQMKSTEHTGKLGSFNCKRDIISLIIPVAWALYSVIVPGAIIAIAYCLSARALKANLVRHENNRAMQLRSKQNTRIVRMFIIIVVIFLLLTMPFATYRIYMRYMLVFDASKVEGPSHCYFYHIIELLAYAVCCVNPIAVSKLHKEINGYLRGITQRIRRVNNHTRTMFAEMKQLTQTFSPRMSTAKDSQN